MSLPVFPAAQLPGITWPIKRSPSWRTIKQAAMSGRRTAFALQGSPTYKYELPLSVMRSASAYAELQTLLGFYNSVYGGQGLFAFYDPNDYLASAQGFGTADGVSTSYQLVRAYGDFAEPVFAPYQATQPGAIPLPAPWQSGNYAPNNILAEAQSPLTGAGVNGMTTGINQTDPNGTNFGLKLTETTANSNHSLYWTTSSLLAGTPFCFSVYLEPSGQRYVSAYCFKDSSNLEAVFDLVGGSVTASAATGSATGLVTAMTPAGGGWYRCSISGIIDFSSTTLTAGLAGNNGSPTTLGFPPYVGSTSRVLTLAFPQIELMTAPGAPNAYCPTLATLSYGSPQVFVDGVYQDPSAYTINAIGKIIFNSAPSSGAALTWTGAFAWPCRFDDDDLGIEGFMNQLFELRSLKFSTELLP